MRSLSDDGEEILDKWAAPPSRFTYSAGPWTRTEELPTPELFEGALVAAAVEPLMQSDNYWAYVRALRFRSGTSVFEKAVALGSSSDPVARAVGADVLAQLRSFPITTAGTAASP